jgi:hypothetical protein
VVENDIKCFFSALTHVIKEIVEMVCKAIKIEIPSLKNLNVIFLSANSSIFLTIKAYKFTLFQVI